MKHPMKPRSIKDELSQLSSPNSVKERAFCKTNELDREGVNFSWEEGVEGGDILSDIIHERNSARSSSSILREEDCLFSRLVVGVVQI